MPNLENITKLRDHIAALPDEAVNMASWGRYVTGSTRNKEDKHALQTLRESGGHNCQTVACIAGYAFSIMPESFIQESQYAGGLFGGTFFAADQLAEEWLGLGRFESDQLFSEDYTLEEAHNYKKLLGNLIAPQHSKEIALNRLNALINKLEKLK